MNTEIKEEQWYKKNNNEQNTYYPFVVYLKCTNQITMIPIKFKDSPESNC